MRRALLYRTTKSQVEKLGGANLLYTVLVFEACSVSTRILPAPL